MYLAIILMSRTSTDSHPGRLVAELQMKTLSAPWNKTQRRIASG